jgi:hypothetical protein
MTDEQVLALVSELNSDFNEEIGEYGGYASYYVTGDVLTVKVQVAVDADGQQPLEAFERSWRVVPVAAEAGP